MRRRTRFPHLGLASLLVFLGAGCERAPSYATGDELLAAMHGEHADDWYRTLFFKQTVTRTAPDGTEQPPETWTEYMEVPGRLRIDLADGYDGNGVIYSGDSLFVFTDGALASREAQTNDLLTLGFDVYGQPPERTVAVLRDAGFDLSKVRQDTWEERPAWVVGADSGDLHTKQFWVDAERLVFVRLLQPFPQATDRTMEIVFAGYEPLAGGWIAPLVLFRLDGREFMREEYFDVVADPELPQGVFDPARWGPVPSTSAQLSRRSTRMERASSSTLSPATMASSPWARPSPST